MANASIIGTKQVEPTNSELETIVQCDTMAPEDEFDLAYSTFTINYQDFIAEEMPDEANEEYRNLEDVYAKNTNPSRLHKIQIEAVKDIMQRYAESQRDE